LVASHELGQPCLAGWTLLGVEHDLDVVSHGDLHELYPYPVDLAHRQWAWERQLDSWNLAHGKEIHVIRIVVVHVIDAIAKPLDVSRRRGLQRAP
jgi:hypothetical protein